MSASVRERTDDRGIELGSATNWPPIIAAACLGLVCLTALTVLGLAAGTAAPEKAPALARWTIFPAPEQPPRTPAPPEPPRLSLLSRPAVVEPAARETPELPCKPLAASEPPPTPSAPEVAPSPPAEPAAVVEAVPVVPIFKRRQTDGEEELRVRLDKEARELDVDAVKGTTAKLLRGAGKGTGADKESATTAPVLGLIAGRDDLRGLPVRNLDECQAPAAEAKTMQSLSREVRDLTARKRSKSSSANAEMVQREIDLTDYLLNKATGAGWREDAGVRLLVQMFEPESSGWCPDSIERGSLSSYNSCS
jgi:hypothetical protein